MKTIFEKSNNVDGITLTDMPCNADFLDASFLRSGDIGLPQLGELEVLRHYKELSDKNFCIEKGFYPLGSCTMKYNPKVNELLATLEGFASLHPLTCDEDAQGALELMYKLQEALKTITGMAYPCGGHCFDDRVIKLITENTPIRYARTTDSHHTFALPEDFMKWNPTCHQNDPELFSIAKDFINAEAGENDLLFYLWGHSFEFDKFGSWEKFEEFCRLISKNRDITYMTCGEIYSYLTKKNAVSF